MGLEDYVQSRKILLRGRIWSERFFLNFRNFIGYLSWFRM